MKTAMQELLENLQKQFDEQTHPIRIDGTYFLEKEKEQILDAVAKARETKVENGEWGFKYKSEEIYNLYK